MSYNACFLIPCYNHGHAIAAVVERLLPFQQPILLINDGSDLKTERILKQLALSSSESSPIHLLTLPQNQGKGAAVMAGIQLANQLGFSHAIQIDADGQHDINALPALIAASKQSPDNIISGRPIYDENVPKARLYGRYITHFWVWIETLSLQLKDCMCGFRVYPLASTIAVMTKHNIGRRMDFDPEIMVRMYWHGVECEFIDTKVTYPSDGLSHFDTLWDNVKISKMHTKLFFAMLPQIPALIKRNLTRNRTKIQDKTASLPTDVSHWSRRKEPGTVWGIKILLAAYSLLGRSVFNMLLYPVIGYYYLTNTSARQASQTYLKQLKIYHEAMACTDHFTENNALKNNVILNNITLSCYQHQLSFGRTLLDKLAAWKGDIDDQHLTISGMAALAPYMNRSYPLSETSHKGLVILGSHLGNLELCRALSKLHTDIKINALVFTEHAEHFNTVMKMVNPASEVNLIQVSHLGPDTAILLQQKIEQGEWIVIVGDRTSTNKEQRVVWANFLGKSAPFPQGPFILASLLKAPVFLLFALRDESVAQKFPQRKNHQWQHSNTLQFKLYFEHFSEQIILPRANRHLALKQVAQQYATRLEHYVLQAPLQWYNFFDFWSLSDKRNNNNDTNKTD